MLRVALHDPVICLISPVADGFQIRHPLSEVDFV
jgi:hypothetical protein